MKVTKRLSRRGFAGLLSSAALATGTLRAAELPDDLDQGFIARIAGNTFAANRLLGTIEAIKPPISAGLALPLLQQEWALRSDLSSALLVLRPRDRGLVVRLEQRALAELFERRAIELVPYASQIGPMATSLPEPVVQDDPAKTLAGALLRGAVNEAALSQLVDLVMSDAGLSRAVAAALEHTQDKNWRALSYDFVDVLTLYSSRAFMDRIVNELDLPTAKQSLRYLSTHFVAFSGWVYVVVQWHLIVKQSWPTLSA